MDARKSGFAVAIDDRNYDAGPREWPADLKRDKVRAAEAKQLKDDGCEPVLTGSRWLLLKRPENLSEKQVVKQSDLLEYNLKSARSQLLKGDFQKSWSYTYAGWAGTFLDAWCSRAMRSKIEPTKQMARTLRNKRELLLNWIAPKGRYRRVLSKASTTN